MSARPLGPRSAGAPDQGGGADAEEAPLTEALVQHHRGLEKALESIAVKAQSKDLPILRAAFIAFELELLGHLNVEEQELLPLYERSHGEDARALRAEHEAIRSRLVTLHLTVDLDPRTADAARSLAVLLAAHTLRESLGLYPWLERNLSHDMWHALGIELRRADSLPSSPAARN
jgi:hemerythrin-like domain-containing protein